MKATIGDLSDSLDSAFDRAENWSVLYVLCALSDLQSSVIPPLPAPFPKDEEENQLFQEPPASINVGKEREKHVSCGDFELLLSGCPVDGESEWERRCSAVGKCVRLTEEDLEKSSESVRKCGSDLLVKRMAKINSLALRSPLHAVATAQRMDLLAPLAVLNSSLSFSEQMERRSGPSLMAAEALLEAESASQRHYLFQIRHGGDLEDEKNAYFAKSDVGWFERACHERALAARRELLGTKINLSDMSLKELCIFGNDSKAFFGANDVVSTLRHRFELLKVSQFRQISNQENSTLVQSAQNQIRRRLVGCVLQFLVRRQDEGVERMKRDLENVSDPDRVSEGKEKYVLFVSHSLTDTCWRGVEALASGGDLREFVILLKSAAAYHQPSNHLFREIDFNRFFK